MGIRRYVTSRTGCAALAIGLAAFGTGCTDDAAPDSSPTTTTTTTTTVSSTPTTAPTPLRECETPSVDPRPEVDIAVQVVLFCGDPNGPPDYMAVDRPVPDDGRPLRAAMEQLLLGVTPGERDAGFGSSFWSSTAGQLIDATERDGVATIDWTRGLVQSNNFSTPGIGGVVLEQVASTVFLFEAVEAIEFLVEGEPWCGWENPCETGSQLRIERDGFAPPECVDAWQSRSMAPIHYEDLVAARLIATAVSKRTADRALLEPKDLGDGFEAADVGDPTDSACTLSIEEPGIVAARSFASNRAEQAVGQRVLVYPDVEDASQAFSAAQAASSCESSEFGPADGAPTPQEVDAADEAFSADYVDSSDAAGFFVARHDVVIVVFESRLHQGAGTDDPVGMRSLINLAIARLE